MFIAETKKCLYKFVRSVSPLLVFYLLMILGHPNLEYVFVFSPVVSYVFKQMCWVMKEKKLLKIRALNWLVNRKFSNCSTFLSIESKKLWFSRKLLFIIIKSTCCVAEPIKNYWNLFEYNWGCKNCKCLACRFVWLFNRKSNNVTWSITFIWLYMGFFY